MVSELELSRLQCLGRPFSGMTQTTLFLNLRVLRGSRYANFRRCRTWCCTMYVHFRRQRIQIKNNEESVDG